MSCVHMSRALPSMCLPITIVSSLNAQAASRLFTNKTCISNITNVWSPKGMFSSMANSLCVDVIAL